MNIAQQIRKALKDVGGRLSLAQMADANSWDADDRRQAGKTVHQMKTRGELDAVIEDGRASYGLVADFEPGRPGPKAQTHDAKAATPTPAFGTIGDLRKPGKGVRQAARETIARAERTESAASETNPPVPETKAGKSETPEATPEPPCGPVRDRAAEERWVNAQIAARRAVAPDFDLSKRIDVIHEDINDALADAIKHGHAKELLTQLHIALGAMNRAGRAYPRS